MSFSSYPKHCDDGRPAAPFCNFWNIRNSFQIFSRIDVLDLPFFSLKSKRSNKVNIKISNQPFLWINKIKSNISTTFDGTTVQLHIQYIALIFL